MPGALQASYLGQGVSFFPSAPSRASSTLSLVPTVSHVHGDIRTMSNALSGAGRNAKGKIVALLRELIATRYLFMANVAKEDDQSLCFEWKKRVGNVKFSQLGMMRLLQEISPDIAADEERVAFMGNYVNDCIPRDKEKGLKDSPLTKESACLPACELPDGLAVFLLQHCYWDRVDVSGAKLKNINFDRVQWGHVILDNANVTGCSFRDCVLEYASMKFTIADGVKFHRSDLTGLIAQGASFLRSKFYGAITLNANFTDAKLEYSKGLRLEQGAAVTNARLTDVVAGWHLDDNPMLAANAADVAHQLKTLESIPSSHDGLHNEMVWKLIEKIDRETFDLSKYPVAIDILLKQVRCWSHKEIESFINNVMLKKLFTQWGTERADDKSLLAYVTHYLTLKKPVFDWVQYCGAVSQLLVNAMREHKTEEAAILSALVKAHLAIYPLAKAMAEKSGIEPFEKCSVFMAQDLDRALVYPTSHLAAMESGLGSPYEKAHYFIRNETGAFVADVLRDLNTIKACQVPLKPYNIDELPPAGAEKMLSYIFAGSEFEGRFIRTLTCNTLPPSEADEAYMRRFLALDALMAEQLDKFITARGDPYIHPQQCERLYRILIAAIPDNPELKSLGGKGHEEEDARNIARMLYCLGTLFVHSSALFGTGKETPRSLRTFARACLNASFSYDPSLMSKRTISAMNAFLEGDVGHSLQCSNDVTNTLLNSIGAKILMQNDMSLVICFKAIYPQAAL